MEYNLIQLQSPKARDQFNQIQVSRRFRRIYEIDILRFNRLTNFNEGTMSYLCTSAKIGEANVSIFRSIFGSPPSKSWRWKGFMAESWDNKGNRIQLTQIHDNDERYNDLDTDDIISDSVIKLKTSWHELLGEKRDDFSDEERRERWEDWKKLALNYGEKELIEYWTDPSACEDCIHRESDWCIDAGLPVTVNPILTMKGGMIGMACMGAGYKAPEAEERA